MKWRALTAWSRTSSFELRNGLVVGVNRNHDLMTKYLMTLFPSVPQDMEDRASTRNWWRLYYICTYQDYHILTNFAFTYCTKWKYKTQSCRLNLKTNGRKPKFLSKLCVSCGSGERVWTMLSFAKSCSICSDYVPFRVKLKKLSDSSSTEDLWCTYRKVGTRYRTYN